MVYTKKKRVEYNFATVTTHCLYSFAWFISLCLKTSFFLDVSFLTQNLCVILGFYLFVSRGICKACGGGGGGGGGIVM